MATSVSAAPALALDYSHLQGKYRPMAYLRENTSHSQSFMPNCCPGCSYYVRMG